MKKTFFWITLVTAVVVAMFYCVNYMLNKSNDEEPQKRGEAVDDGAATPGPKPDDKDYPPGIPHREIITNQLLELPDNADAGGKLLFGPFIYPNSRVFFQSNGIEANSTPQVELRFWKRENQELVPWDGKVFYVKPKNKAAQGFNAFLWHYEPGKSKNGLVLMDAVRVSVLAADFKQEENPDVICFLQLGQEYIIDCRGEYGKPIGRGQIRVPETLEKNQVVVFNVIANEYYPPSPKVNTLP